jgi:hypothetical protein
MSGQDENPFDLQKASHYSSEEILGYWVDITEQPGGLVSVLKPTSIMPMFLLGGKGSGKTHLMRFCSAPVRAAHYGGDLLSAIKADRYAGIYVPAEALNTHKFSGKGLDTEAWSSVFSMYFEAWLATTLLLIVQEAIKEKFNQPQADPFTSRLRSLFNVDVDINTLADLLQYLVALRRKVDFVVNNSAITRNISSLEVPFSTGSLLFGVPDLVAETFEDLGNPLFVYLVDELENFTNEQQKFLNTLIRYRKGRSTIKVGTRLYGVKTFATLGSGEPIKLGSEFDQVELDAILRDPGTEYRAFAIKLTLRRLGQGRLSSAIRDEASLIGAFEELDKSDYWRVTTVALMKSYDDSGRPRPHMQTLGRKLSEADIPARIIDEVLETLRMPDHPILEKNNTFIFIRRWRGGADLAVSTAKKVAQQASAFRAKGRASAQDYTQVLDHFSSDLLAQMYRSARQPIPYAGFDTLVELSQGIPRNLLILLAQIYRRALFAGEQPFAGGKISIASQTNGVIEGAKSFWDDAQPDADASDVRDSMEGLALLFRSIRFSDAPSECDLCTFSIALDKLTDKSRHILSTAEKWSHLIRIPEGAKNRNYRSIDAKLQFAPMLAPRWELSHHRRGAIELRAELANAIFDPAERDRLVQLVRSRIARMNAPNMWQHSHGQTTLL